MFRPFRNPACPALCRIPGSAFLRQPIHQKALSTSCRRKSTPWCTRLTSRSASPGWASPRRAIRRLSSASRSRKTSHATRKWLRPPISRPTDPLPPAKRGCCREAPPLFLQPKPSGCVLLTGGFDGLLPALDDHLVFVCGTQCVSLEHLHIAQVG